MNIATIAREHYLPAIEKRRCKDTANSYRSSLELHVLPYFGMREIEDLEHDDIQDWVDKIAPECGPGGAEWHIVYVARIDNTDDYISQLAISINNKVYSRIKIVASGARGISSRKVDSAFKIPYSRV